MAPIALPMTLAAPIMIQHQLYLGENVDIHGDTIVVGATSNDDKGRDSGSAYIYHKDPETKEWLLQQKLVADDGAAGDYFGVSVSIYKGTLVVGSIL